MILEGKRSSPEALPLIREMLDWIAAFDGPIPGASPGECGNYSGQNLNMAGWEAARYATVLQNPGEEIPSYPS